MNFKFLERYSGPAASIIAIIIGLLAGFVVLLISSAQNALPAFVSILTGAVADPKQMGQTLYVATPIIMTGLSVAFASKTGLFNIGASGQFIVGAFVAVFVGVKMPGLGVMQWPVALVGAALAGALWGAIPGFLKAARNVNEVISCIMMNYIGMLFVNYLVRNTVFDAKIAMSAKVAPTANLPRLGLDKLFQTNGSSSSVNGGFIFAVLFVVLTYFILEKTTFGFAIKACGSNKDAAKYAGINAERGIVTSMLIAGALSGLSGAFVYLAGSGRGIEVKDVLAAEGFNGIPVALLALNHPVGVLFSGLFVAYLSVGGLDMQLHGFSPQVIEIIVAIIIYFSAFSLFIRGFFKRKESNI